MPLEFLLNVLISMERSAISSRVIKIPNFKGRLPERDLYVYLPPRYDEQSDQRYPVLYMHDGQNIFDNKTSYAGEWNVDESLNNLYDEENFGMIVVAIDNGLGDRQDEYSPWINEIYGGGQGEAYVAFIVETLKTFRTPLNWEVIGDDDGSWKQAAL